MGRRKLGKRQINYFLTAPFKRVLSMFYLCFKQTRRIYHDGGGKKTSAESFGPRVARLWVTSRGCVLMTLKLPLRCFWRVGGGGCFAWNAAERVSDSTSANPSPHFTASESLFCDCKILISWRKKLFCSFFLLSSLTRLTGHAQMTGAARSLVHGWKRSSYIKR